MEFSVVIPTLSPTLCKTFINQLKRIHQSSVVNEIIIIDNAVPQTPFDLSDTMSKVKHIKNGLNAFVNSSWNQGVLLSSSEDIIIVNDDITFDCSELDKIAIAIDGLEYGMVGMDSRNYHLQQSQDVELHAIDEISFGYACFFIIKKSQYTIIPQELKIFCGDNWLFDNTSSTNYTLSGLPLGGKIGTSSGLPKFRDIIQRDVQLYSQLKVKDC